MFTIENPLNFDISDYIKLIFLYNTYIQMLSQKLFKILIKLIKNREILEIFGLFWKLIWILIELLNCELSREKDRNNLHIIKAL